MSRRKWIFKNLSLLTDLNFKNVTMRKDWKIAPIVSAYLRVRGSNHERGQASTPLANNL